MSTKGDKLHLAGRVASFVLAWGIIGHQLWRTQYGQEPNTWMMGLAASIIAPAAFQFVAQFMLPTGSKQSSSSESDASQPSPSSSQ